MATKKICNRQELKKFLNRYEEYEYDYDENDPDSVAEYEAFENNNSKHGVVDEYVVYRDLEKSYETKCLIVLDQDLKTHYSVQVSSSPYMGDNWNYPVIAQEVVAKEKITIEWVKA